MSYREAEPSFPRSRFISAGLAHKSFFLSNTVATIIAPNPVILGPAPYALLIRPIPENMQSEPWRK